MKAFYLKQFLILKSAEQHPIRGSMLWNKADSLINNMIDQWNIPSGLAPLCNSRCPLDTDVKRLVGAGLLNQEGYAFSLTPLGQSLVDKYHRWDEFPLSFVVKNNEVQILKSIPKWIKGE